MEDPRPGTTAGMLREVVEWLDIGDKAVKKLSEISGRSLPMPLGRSVQGDLLLIAAWFDDHPEVDQTIHDCVSAVEGR